MRAEKIRMEGLENTRDLGGIVNKEGKRIKKKKLLRSGALFWAKGDDLKRLYEEYELRHVIDMRNAEENISCPEPSYKDVKYVHNPIFSYRKEGITREEDMDFEQIMKDLAFQKDKIVKMMQDMYGQIASLDEAKEAYSAFIHYLLAAHEGSVLWHCSMGKDRAGVASILVLKLLDVDEETILEDYLYTNACYGFTEERPTYYFDIVMKEYLDSYLEKTGDLDAYIEKEIGITKAEKARFREMYLE